MNRSQGKTQYASDIKIVNPFGCRLPVVQRQVCVQTVAERARYNASVTDSWAICLDKGEDHDTLVEGVTVECALAVSDPSGFVVVWIGRLISYSNSDRAIAHAAFPRTADLFDARVTSLDRRRNAWEAVERAHNKLFSPLERLAACADDQ